MSKTCRSKTPKSKTLESLTGASASHQNGVAEHAIKTVVNMASVILMQAWMVCHKDTLSIDFGQWEWTTLYGSKVGSLIHSMV